MDKKMADQIEAYKEARNMNDILESRWITKFLELLAFKKEHGHTDVPIRYERNRSLGSWVKRQRYLHTTNKADTMREDLLKAARFNFRILPVHDWENMFGKLEEFKEKHGHAHITEFSVMKTGNCIIGWSTRGNFPGEENSTKKR